MLLFCASAFADMQAVPCMCCLVAWLPKSMRNCLPQGSAVSAPLVHPLRVFRPLNLLAPPNTTEPLNFVGNVLEDRVAESASELVDAIEQGTASSRKAVKAVIG